VTDDSLPARLAPTMLSILRIVAALLFIEHGLSRLFGYPSPLPTPPLFTLYWFAFESVRGHVSHTHTLPLLMSGKS